MKPHPPQKHDNYILDAFDEDANELFKMNKGWLSRDIDTICQEHQFATISNTR